MFDIAEEDPIKTFTLKLNETVGLYDFPSVVLNLATPIQMTITEILDERHGLLGLVKDYTGIKNSKDPIEEKDVSWDGLIYNLGNKVEPGPLAFELQVNPCLQQLSPQGGSSTSQGVPGHSFCSSHGTLVGGHTQVSSACLLNNVPTIALVLGLGLAKAKVTTARTSIKIRLRFFMIFMIILNCVNVI
ncbi:15997_t:CDS:2 [Funneliformis geosporum]|nr:15997_t:CDS:2 [Funneliformis geosporum]